MALKYSRQRELIKNALASRTDHPTADTLYADIRIIEPNISMGTVYRNLNLLASMGEIKKLTFASGADHFDANTAQHYHFVCKECGRVLDMPIGIADGLNSQAEQMTGRQVDEHEIVFYGVCKDCKELKQ